MYQTNGSGPQINPGPGLAPQPQSTYGMNPGGHAQTLADLVAQYRAKPMVQVNQPPQVAQPVQPAQPRPFMGRFREFREQRGLGRLFGSYFK